MFVCLLLVQEDGHVVWCQDSVYLTKPSINECIDVITKLEDQHNIMAFSESSSDSIQFLIPTILERRTMKKLVIYLSCLTRNDILSFSSELSTNKSLTTLALADSSISDDGVIALAQSLQYNETLQYLILKYNPDITSASAQSLAELLLTNNTLNRLDLHHTSIDTDGVMILMESLKINETLRKLRLDKHHKETCATLPHYKLIRNRIIFM